ncbi:MAG: hypothetical protein U0M21_00500 [Emergencia sp.]|nr:hypothetical protein [Emergencia sp.]
MNSTNIENSTNTIFDSIKHYDSNGSEYWFARELQSVLEYKEWRNFEKVILNHICLFDYLFISS